MFRFAIGNLLSRPLRTCLALSGLIIAIASMTILFSIANGIDDVVTRSFQQIPGLVIQERGSPLPIFSSLPAEWGREIASLPGVSVVDAEQVQRLNVLEGKTLIAPPRFLVGFELPDRLELKQDIYRDHVVEGRFLLAEDLGQQTCLISRQIASDIGKGVGDTILLNRTPTKVVGIYDTGSMLLDGNILLDLKTLQKMFRLNPQSVSGFYVEAKEGTSPQELKKQIEQHFVGRDTREQGSAWTLESMLEMARLWVATGGADSLAIGETPKPEPPTSGAAPKPVSAVEVRLAQDWSDRFSEMTGDLRLFLGLITAMGVTIALLSIMNTMLMSVTERATEFGILRANGWSKANVIQLMTLESALIGIVGGLIGVALGWGATQLINSMFPDRMHLVAGPGLLIFGAIFSFILGLVGGLYPASRAAAKSPMEAIRRG